MPHQLSLIVGLSIGLAGLHHFLHIWFPHAVADYDFLRAVICALVVNSVLAVIWNVLVKPTFVDPLRHLPSLKGGYPLIRHTFEDFQWPPSELFLNWMDEFPSDGLIRVPRFAGTYELLPTNPKVLSELLVTKSYDFQKQEHGRKLLRLVLGDGLVVAEGDIHKFQRKNIQPMFNFRKVKALYPLMWEKAVEMTKCVNAHMLADNSRNDEKGTVVEVNQWASRATLDIIGIAALGREFNTLNNADDELSHLYQWLFHPDAQRVLWAILHNFIPRKVMSWMPWKAEQETITKTLRLREIINELVKSKRETMKAESTESVDILAHLISSNNFSDGELVDQVLTFLAAGHETTSSAFAWVLYLLASEPKYQSLVRNELREAMGSNDMSDLNMESILESLPYLNGTCSEALRIFAPVNNTRRVAVRDTVIDQHPIRAGTTMFVPIWSFNKSTKFWGPKAKEFYPERWIDFEDGKPPKPNNHGGAVSNYSLLTFSHGPRSCIGQGFSRLELRTLVAAWVHAFEFEMANPSEKVTPFGLVALKPKNGLWLKIRPSRSW